MKKILKKSIAIFMLFTFLTSLVLTSSAISMSSNLNTSVKIVTAESTSQFKEVTIFRHGPDKSITPMTVTIEIKNNQDLGEAIADKCLELFDNDTEMQPLISFNNSTTTILSKIRSHGRGLHLKSMFHMQLLKRLKILPFLPPYFRTAIFLPVNFCKYSNDPKAKTVVKPIISQENKTYEGPHSVLNIGFIGYSGWIGHVSYLGFILRTGYAGVSAFTRVKEL